jgi:hypothetical protein
MLTAFHEKILEIIGETEIVVDLTARTPVVEGPTTGTNPQ